MRENLLFIQEKQVPRLCRTDSQGESVCFARNDNMDWLFQRRLQLLGLLFHAFG